MRRIYLNIIHFVHVSMKIYGTCAGGSTDEFQDASFSSVISSVLSSDVDFLNSQHTVTVKSSIGR